MKKLFQIMEKTDTRLGRALDGFLICLITINIFLVVLDSYKSINAEYGSLFAILENISVAIFTIEYILRLISSPFHYSETYNPHNILRYVIRPIALIDLFAILPFYLPILIGFDFRILRILRVFRLLRVLKIKRYSKALDLIIIVFRKKRAELILSSFILIVLIFFAGSLMYYTENEVQPEAFPNIIDSVRWAVCTMVFLGYDSASPVTPLGGILGMIIIVLGLGWLTLPISILSSGFIEQVSEAKTRSDNLETTLEAPKYERKT